MIGGALLIATLVGMIAFAAREVAGIFRRTPRAGVELELRWRECRNPMCRRPIPVGAYVQYCGPECKDVVRRIRQRFAAETNPESDECPF